MYRKYEYLNKYDDNYIIWLSIFNILYIIVELWILKIVIGFYNYLLRLSTVDRNKLLIGTYIPVKTTYIFS